MARAQHDIELTPRQREVLRLVVRGHTNGEIAERLGISLQGAKWHVRELLTKFGVESREELIEARRATARAATWLSALAGTGFMKAAATSAAGGLAVLVGVGVISVVANLGSGDSAAVGSDAGSPATATDPAPPVVDLLAPDGQLMKLPGAVWSPAEALSHASRLMEADISSGDGLNELVAVPLQVSAVPLIEADWHPPSTRFDSSDGDTFWDASNQRDNRPRTLWHFRWELDGVPGRTNAEGHTALPSGTVRLEVLIEDGDSSQPVAILAYLIDPDEPLRRVGHSGGFSSRRQEVETDAFTKRVGPSVIVATANNVAGGSALGIYPTAAGTWCFDQADGGYFCSFEPANPSLPVLYTLHIPPGPTERRNRAGLSCRRARM
jgi:DNA-binding CsgD family transcriptional regulator